MNEVWAGFRQGFGGYYSEFDGSGPYSIDSSGRAFLLNEDGTPLPDRIALGLVSGHRRIALYGNNNDIDTGTVPEDVWPGGGVYPWLTAATSLEVLSASASDAPAGTGLRSMLVRGLDANYAEISEVVNLNGITPVALSQQFFRINEAIPVSAGSGKVNAGDITIRDAGGGTTRGIMPASIGSLRQCIYTVPLGYDLVIASVLAVINRVDTADRWATVSSWVGTATGLVIQPAEVGITTEPFRDNYAVPAVLPEKTDTTIRVLQVSGNNTNMTANIMGYLRPRA